MGRRRRRRLPVRAVARSHRARVKGVRHCKCSSVSGLIGFSLPCHLVCVFFRHQTTLEDHFGRGTDSFDSVQRRARHAAQF